MGTHESPRARPNKLHHEIITTTSRVLPKPLGQTTTRAIWQTTTHGRSERASKFGEGETRLESDERRKTTARHTCACGLRCTPTTETPVRTPPDDSRLVPSPKAPFVFDLAAKHARFACRTLFCRIDRREGGVSLCSSVLR